MDCPRREDVLRAHEQLANAVIRTPLCYAEGLSQLTGGNIYLKLESMQRTGAFKLRGALNFIRAYAGEARGVVAASSGNHALGIALACQMSDLPATVVMPHTAPQVKQAKARAYGAQVILHGGVYDEVRTYAESLAEREGMVFAPSFDHPLIIAGQGTVGCELLEQCPQADLALMPVGGGGLLAGLMLVAPPRLTLIGVQATGAASMAHSLQAGSLQSLSSANTIADGIATLRPGRLNFSLVHQLGGSVITVSDAAILDAMATLLGEGVVAEPAAAAPVAALLSRELPVEEKNVVCIITGRNLSGHLLRETAERWAQREKQTKE